MKIFEHERRLERHRLQIAERLRGFLAVVERLGARLVLAHAGRISRFRNQFTHVAATADQSAGNAPLEGSEIQRRAGRPNEAHRSHLFHRFHHHDGRGRAEQNFQALEGIGHKGLGSLSLTMRDLLP